MKRPRPIYIRPETVSIGDTIKVAVQVRDMAVARVGVVAHREIVGQSVKFTTRTGCVLLEYTPGTRDPYKITRLDVADSPQTMLEFTGLEPDINVHG